MNVAFRKSLSRMFSFSRTFIYINSYLEVTKFSAGLFVSAQCQYFVCMRCDVCRATACWLAAFSLALSLFPMALLSPFVFVMSVALSHSSTSPLKAVNLSPSLTVCLMFGPLVLVCCAVLVIWWHCFQCYLSILHAALALLLCCVRVILLPSVVLSLHYLLGCLRAVVPVLSCATIKVVTLLPGSILKCSQGRRLLSAFPD